MTSSSPSSRPAAFALSVHLQQHLFQAALLVLLLAPLALAAHWGYGKYQLWQNNLQRAESLHARLQGMQQQQEQIAQALQHSEQAQAAFFYPASTEAEQAANTALQHVRQAFSQAGMKVESSQVKIPQPNTGGSTDAESDEEQYSQRVELLISAEGNWASLQLALAALRELRPVVWLDRMHLGTRMRLQSAIPGHEQNINASFTLSLRKLKEGA